MARVLKPLKSFDENKWPSPLGWFTYVEAHLAEDGITDDKTKLAKIFEAMHEWVNNQVKSEITRTQNTSYEFVKKTILRFLNKHNVSTRNPPKSLRNLFTFARGTRVFIKYGKNSELIECNRTILEEYETEINRQLAHIYYNGELDESWSYERIDKYFENTKKNQW